MRIRQCMICSMWKYKYATPGISFNKACLHDNKVTLKKNLQIFHVNAMHDGISLADGAFLFDLAV